MSDTTLNIPVPMNTWVNIYSESGIAVGNKISVQVSQVDSIVPRVFHMKACISATEPDGTKFTSYKTYDSFTVPAGESGLWVFCDADAIVNVTDLSSGDTGTTSEVTLSSSQREEQIITIANGATNSDAIDLRNTSFIGYVMASAWTTAALNLQVSNDGTNWSSAYDQYGSVVGSIASPIASGRYAVDVQSLLPWKYARFVSSVAQGDDRTLIAIKRVLA